MSQKFVASVGLEELKSALSEDQSVKLIISVIDEQKITLDFGKCHKVIYVTSLQSSAKQSPFASQLSTPVKTPIATPFSDNPSHPSLLKTPSWTVAKDICLICQSPVYENEKSVLNDSIYHQACLRCCQCRVRLNSESFAKMERKPFCKLHYKETFNKEYKSLDFVPLEISYDDEPKRRQNILSPRNNGNFFFREHQMVDESQIKHLENQLNQSSEHIPRSRGRNIPLLQTSGGFFFGNTSTVNEEEIEKIKSDMDPSVPKRRENILSPRQNGNFFFKQHEIVNSDQILHLENQLNVESIPRARGSAIKQDASFFFDDKVVVQTPREEEPKPRSRNQQVVENANFMFQKMEEVNVNEIEAQLKVNEEMNPPKPRGGQQISEEGTLFFQPEPQVKEKEVLTIPKPRGGKKMQNSNTFFFNHVVENIISNEKINDLNKIVTEDPEIVPKPRGRKSIEEPEFFFSPKQQDEEEPTPKARNTRGVVNPDGSFFFGKQE